LIVILLLTFLAALSRVLLFSNGKARFASHTAFFFFFVKMISKSFLLFFLLLLQIMMLMRRRQVVLNGINLQSRSLQVLAKALTNLDASVKVALFHRHSFFQRKRRCKLDDGANLTSVEVVLCEIRDIERALSKASKDKQLRPNLQSLTLAESRITQGNADARVERTFEKEKEKINKNESNNDARIYLRIKRLDSVCCQKENSSVVLQKAQENSNQSVTLNVLQCAPLKENVGFIEQNHTVPTNSNFKHLRKGLFKRRRLRTKLSNAN
jgi:hypothetical protein